MAERQTHASTDPHEARVLTRAGAGIHHWTAGPDDAPAVVLTHGVTLDHGTYAGQVPALLEAGYRVITWDLRGHGRSRPTVERFGIQSTVDDLRALLDELRVEQAVLVGQSFGGSIVQELYRRTPERVAGLVLVGTPALGEPVPWHHRVLSRARPGVLRLWPEGPLRRTLPGFMSKKDSVRRYVAEATRPLSKADLVTVTEAAVEVLLDLPPLEEVRVPVLVTMGDTEMPMVAAMIRAWAERDPQVRVAVVEGAGHLANQDNPDAFNGILLDFLRRHAPVGGP
ncbi:MAG: alpha/beta fold hydrolase [Myxococcales bacterium]|nr:alpha/beta fold hydrolase [Myxococcales bacterium]